jgi:hypothetical protein
MLITKLTSINKPWANTENAILLYPETHSEPELGIIKNSKADKIGLNTNSNNALRPSFESLIIYAQSK